jgi:hypothetical protein
VVFDLPAKLRVCLEQDALALAVSYHSQAAPILRRYGRDALAAIAKEVAAAMGLVLQVSAFRGDAESPLALRARWR